MSVNYQYQAGHAKYVEIAGVYTFPDDNFVLYVINTLHPQHSMIQDAGMMVGIDPNTKEVIALTIAEHCEGLTEEEVVALAMHELGHVQNGDLEEVKQVVDSLSAEELAGSIGCLKLLVRDEIAADNYAISRVGKSVYHAAFLKFVRKTMAFSEERLSIVFQDRLLNMSA